MYSVSTSAPREKLHATVVHGGDNILRARSAAVQSIMDTALAKSAEVLKVQTDMVLIFSWARTAGKDNPSEAEKMYDIFAKRLKVLDKEKKICGWVSFPEDVKGLSQWKIRIGEREVLVCLEDESVDTEDNAEKSMKIIEKLASEKNYDRILISPLSSEFHTKRIGQAFKRYVPEDFSAEIAPVSAEKSLGAMGGKYEKYGKLKKASVSCKTKVLEIGLRFASKFPKGREKIREITQTRVSE